MMINISAGALKIYLLLPDGGNYSLTDSSRQQFETVKRAYIGKADIIVNAGDPDREGQLLVDEGFILCRKYKTCTTYFIKCIGREVCSCALSDLRDNQDFHNLYQSALAKSACRLAYWHEFISCLYII